MAAAVSEKRMADARAHAERIAEKHLPAGSRVQAMRVYAGEPYVEVLCPDDKVRTVWPERA
jgi:hypothetical protein